MTREIASQNTEDIFGGQKLNITGIDPILGGIESAANSGRRFLRAHPGTLSGVALCGLTTLNPSPETPTVLDPIALRCVAFGSLCALEEVFEVEHQTPQRKAVSIVLKFFAGTGFAAAAPEAANDVVKLANNFDVNSLINSAPHIGIAVSSGAVIAHETDFVAAGRGIKGIAVKIFNSTAGKVVEGVDFSNNYFRLTKLINEAHYNGNKQSQIAAKEQAIDELSQIGFKVYQRDQRGEIQGINQGVINTLYAKMGPDHRLQEAEARELYNILKPSKNPQEQQRKS